MSALCKLKFSLRELHVHLSSYLKRNAIWQGEVGHLQVSTRRRDGERDGERGGEGRKRGQKEEEGGRGNSRKEWYNLLFSRCMYIVAFLVAETWDSSG